MLVVAILLRSATAEQVGLNRLRGIVIESVQVAGKD